MTTCMEARDCSPNPSTCGSLCDVVSASKYEIVCDTRPATASVDRTGHRHAGGLELRALLLQVRVADLHAAGLPPAAANASACEFSTSRTPTPRLVYEPPSYIAAGDVVTFALRHRTDSPVATSTGSPPARARGRGRATSDWAARRPRADHHGDSGRGGVYADQDRRAVRRTQVPPRRRRGARDDALPRVFVEATATPKSATTTIR